MFQDFTVASVPENGPPRIAALRRAMADAGVQGFLVPRADAHQGEYVADRDARLAWLTGFTGSAGIAVVLADRAALFVDGRYTLQAAAQVDTGVLTLLNIPADTPGAWVAETLSKGAVLAYDPWLHTMRDLETLREALAPAGIVLRPVANLVDAVWTGQPAPPRGKVVPHPVEFAGRTHDEKRADLAAGLRKDGVRAAVLSLPDSISWLLNIRGADLPRVPVVQGFAILHDDGAVALFADPAKFDEGARAHLGDAVRIATPDAFGPALDALAGPVGVDKASAPSWVADRLTGAGVEIRWMRDPCVLPKACKTAAELAGTRAAHLRDGAAMVEFLAWLDAEAPKGTLTEIDVVRALEARRRASNALKDISFDTICGAGPDGAIVHYRVSEATNRAVRPGELLLVDSGGQYADGTTDITRTVAIGAAPEEAKRPFTLVLKGMIAISRARWPEGLAGRDLDALARRALWDAGMDYDHGTGHGVGAFLSVHEGPQNLSRRGEEPLRPGMILSNEPGYYRTGAFGIRIENLVAVNPPSIPRGGERAMLSFETLTLCPIDLSLIDASLLDAGERAWLDAYHMRVREALGPQVSEKAGVWLERATRPV
ncbi:aminopeptidase P family protein [Halovulum dunhuangense]|uniref:Aminopeptidase P family protein n=1 Tax=Halovulum dunhuangense TaxID=1505036 RepID=A0A849L166_9RHOB|nr:aminopeptidase P family protein [Halovulum dunhuangense]NNU80026.1 aminopeptidase P family protein [Halovulum dunhuangense]